MCGDCRAKHMALKRALIAMEYEKKKKKRTNYGL
jgi:hypothetical protein